MSKYFLGVILLLIGACSGSKEQSNFSFLRSHIIVGAFDSTHNYVLPKDTLAFALRVDSIINDKISSYCIDHYLMRIGKRPYPNPFGPSSSSAFQMPISDTLFMSFYTTDSLLAVSKKFLKAGSYWLVIGSGRGSVYMVLTTQKDTIVQGERISLLLP